MKNRIYGFDAAVEYLLRFNPTAATLGKEYVENSLLESAKGMDKYDDITASAILGYFITRDGENDYNVYVYPWLALGWPTSEGPEK